MQLLSRHVIYFDQMRFFFTENPCVPFSTEKSVVSECLGRVVSQSDRCVFPLKC